MLRQLVVEGNERNGVLKQVGGWFLKGVVREMAQMGEVVRGLSEVCLMGGGK